MTIRGSAAAEHRFMELENTVTTSPEVERGTMRKTRRTRGSGLQGHQRVAVRNRRGGRFETPVRSETWNFLGFPVR